MTIDRETMLQSMTMAIAAIHDDLRHGELKTCPACRARAEAALDALLARLLTPPDELLKAATMAIRVRGTLFVPLKNQSIGPTYQVINGDEIERAYQEQAEKTARGLLTALADHLAASA